QVLAVSAELEILWLHDRRQSSVLTLCFGEDWLQQSMPDRHVTVVHSQIKVQAQKVPLAVHGRMVLVFIDRHVARNAKIFKLNELKPCRVECCHRASC